MLDDWKSKRRVRGLHTNFPGMWDSGVAQAEEHFATHYGSRPPQRPTNPDALMRLAGHEADAYVPGLMTRFVELGNDLDDLDTDAILAFQHAFQKRLTELFIGWPKGTLLRKGGGRV